MSDYYIKISAQEYSTSSRIRPVKKLIFTERMCLLTIYFFKINIQKLEFKKLYGISRG
jgi:hypothetical protein